jgi:hypothetical protein
MRGCRRTNKKNEPPVFPLAVFLFVIALMFLFLDALGGARAWPPILIGVARRAA